MSDELRDTHSDTWVATDGLGRTLPGYKECGPPRPGKFVGIFYFLWLGAHSRGVYDITKILSANPGDPQWGPVNAFHFWGEPHLGYYLSDDEFVIRKHAQMLTDAGVDVLFFDVTNGFTYDENYLTLCRVFDEIRKTGRATPQISFLTNAGSATVVQRLYDRLYSQNLYSHLWFRWKGKPLILAPAEGLSDQLREFFTLRQSWAWTDPNGWFGEGRDKWPWLDNYPQRPGWHDSPNTPEQVAVCVAQHPSSNIGRSFHDGKEPPPDRIAPEQGLCFSEQWRRALEVDPEFIFITGWNEWVAQRFLNQGEAQLAGRPLKAGETLFVDQYSQEYSRDIEPMRGGHGDDYYYLMVANLRRFKGVRQPPKSSPHKSIRITNDFRQWQDVGPEFLDDLGDTAPRNHPGWDSAVTYTNNTGRNDFDMMKVARDTKNLYFHVRTREPIATPLTANSMILLLDVDSQSPRVGDHRTGWEGYDFIVHRPIPGKTTSLLERNVAGEWKWEPVAEVKQAFKGKEMHLAIPRAALRLESKKGRLRLDFKWVDNVPGSGNILDFIDQGDVAPNGRFNYRYEERE